VAHQTRHSATSAAARISTYKCQLHRTVASATSTMQSSHTQSQTETHSHASHTPEDAGAAHTSTAGMQRLDSKIARAAQSPPTASHTIPPPPPSHQRPTHLLIIGSRATVESRVGTVRARAVRVRARAPPAPHPTHAIRPRRHAGRPRPANRPEFAAAAPPSRASPRSRSTRRSRRPPRTLSGCSGTCPARPRRSPWRRPSRRTCSRCRA